ncbi:nucleolar protein 5a (macronuclear) [Tetrahymena thermophila SB210]|uniref:Nucleolar protein 56 n=1 Tax=Tetrahymena thermophila (strain SB210) TaxID=312017 RepID=I7MGX3_TETTS|nr:nucleolar protein 5a [Tetrahymena thermophila SB210]EAS02123.1 nucleolar protein 5a [Tetrahymena thermophila SB210]|eukprot:XP_001022368.1 nucleolar protein 5a [Tetrahymena thermophila SB210]
MVLYLIHDNAVGFSLFEVKEFDEAQAKVKQIQKQIIDFSSFSQMCQLKAFHPFLSADSARDAAQNVGCGELTEDLKNFIEENIPKSKKKGKIQIGVLDSKLAQKMNDQLQYETITGDIVFELFRGIRMHLVNFLKNENFKEEDLIKAQLGLAHSWSRNRIQFDVKRQDKPIINCIAVLEQLDKDVNTLCMRIKEWYGWHFPELAKIVTDNEVYTRLVDLFGPKTNATQDMLEKVEEIVIDADISQQVIDAAKTSAGQDLSEMDNTCLKELCGKIIKLIDFRKGIQSYLKSKMDAVAPNLTSLIGEGVGAKLISHAGGLSNLVKYPASTVQILGAEKALFQALKKKANTPKYGLLFHSTFIGKADGKNKGKVSRYLANKCSMAARLDYFLVNPTNRFGERMKTQVEDRLKFLTSGGESAKNIDAMQEVLEELKQENLYVESEEQLKKKSKKDKKKKKKASVEIQELEEEVEEVEKKKKKKKKASVELQELEEEVAEEQVEKKKKKKKSKEE